MACRVCIRKKFTQPLIRDFYSQRIAESKLCAIIKNYMELMNRLSLTSLTNRTTRVSVRLPIRLLKAGFFQALALTLVATIFTGCETPGNSALAGAGAGAAAGALLKGTGRGALQGAAIGGVGGYALGKYAEGERAKGYVAGQNSAGYAPAPQVYVQQQPVYVPPPEPRYVEYPEHRHHHSIPMGRYCGRYGYVYSPYTGELVNVRGIPHGAEVRDPSSGRIFINP